MIRQLITFPLRATWWGAELLLDGAARGLSVARELTGHSGRESAASAQHPEPAPDGARRASRSTSQNGSGQGSAPNEPQPAEAAEASEPATTADARPAAKPAAPSVIAPREPPSPAEPERAPAHIDDEPELVAESADPGAADGAGAELTIDEPWDGYRRLNADDIIDRLAVATDAELAVVELYESVHKRRRTVLSAVARQQHRPHNRSSQGREE